MKFLYKNLIDSADATLTYSSEVATLPGDYILDRRRGKAWRTTGISQEWVKLEFAEAQYFNSLGLAGFNLSPTATVTLQANNSDDWSDPPVNEEFEVWEPVIGYDEDLYGDHSYGGYIADDDAPRYATMTRFLDQSERYLYIRVVFDDPDNPDGYIDMGRVFVGEAYEPYGYHQYGGEIIPVDPSIITKSEGGQAFVDIKNPYSIIKFNLKNLQDKEAYYRFMRIMQDCGRKQNIFICMDPDSEEGRLFTSLYGFFQNDKLPIGNYSNNRWKADIVFEEAV